jgi:RNA polymerase sigma-70 factor (ECF subfamily)
MLGEAGAAEDVTQEVFLRVHRHRDSVPPPDGVLAWLYRITTNLCLNALRDRAVRPVPVEVPPELPGESQQELLADRDLAARLVARVSPKLRDAAWLCYVDGLGQEEAAAVLRVSRRTVAARLAEFLVESRKFVSRSEL